jgi:hypothetical protein
MITIGCIVVGDVLFIPGFPHSIQMRLNNTIPRSHCHAIDDVLNINFIQHLLAKYQFVHSSLAGITSHQPSNSMILSEIGQPKWWGWAKT